MSGLHVYSDIEQRSPEWYAARCGIVTASVVGKLLTFDSPSSLEVPCPECEVDAGMLCASLARRKSEPPKTLKNPHAGRIAVSAAKPPVLKVADNDMARGITTTLLAERITGIVEETPISNDMWRGIEHEPYARDIYSGHHQQAVECGFMRFEGDGWTLGYSPDGVVADDGLVEIKCPRAKGHISTILANKVPTFYMGQLQAGLLVSGRKWIDYVSFCAGLPLFVKRVLPDPAWFAAITAACIQFETTAAEMGAAYTEATKDLPATERIDYEMSL